MEVQVIHLRCLQRFILSGSYKMSMSSRKPFSLTNGTDCITTRAYGVPELQLELEDRRMGHPPFYMEGKLGKGSTQQMTKESRITEAALATYPGRKLTNLMEN